MMTDISQTILNLIVILVFYTLDTYFITRFEPDRRGAGSGRNRIYSGLVGIFVICLAAQPIFLPWLSITIPGIFGLSVQIVGISLVIMGVGLHVWSRQHLKQFYSERLELLADHRVIKSGPYASLRHPIITSFFLLTAGLLLINPSLPAFLVFCSTVWYFTKSAKEEEQLLSRFLPGYRMYMLQTGAYRPRINKTRQEQKPVPKH